MNNQWYYARDGGKIGPFTADRLKELAGAGQILPTDTVWKEGVERGVPASRVQHLFAPAVVVAQAQGPLPMPASAQVPAPSPMPVGETINAGSSAGSTPSTGIPLVDDAQQEPSKEAAPKPSESNPQQPGAKKGRAMAGRGAVIISQDGFSVQFRKKCLRCNHEDASKSRMPIRSGVTRASYFCPKCRKIQQVEIQGVV